MRAEQRPWVSFNPSNGISRIQPLSFDPKTGANMSLRYILRNTGNTPAIKVNAKSKLVIISWAKPANMELVDQQKSLCEAIGDPTTNPFTPTIFPKDRVEQDDPVNVDQATIEASMKARKASGIAREGFIAIGLATCIDYQLYDGEHHQTGYTFMFGTNGVMGDIQASGTRPEAKLILLTQSAN
jgi:hypothetical protein